MVLDYQKMLKKAREDLPDSVIKAERFEIPKVRGHLQGNRTIISNFNQIASELRRPVEHILKYLLKELATPGELKQSGLIIGSKVAASRINEKIIQYARQFVLCRECGKPDTKITKEDNVSYLICTACGAKYYIKA
ncbi:translation initiation factor IF-2 subunit beta [Nanoarchaeota archaeon]